MNILRDLVAINIGPSDWTLYIQMTRVQKKRTYIIKIDTEYIIIAGAYI